MSFFATTDTGITINRFSQDLQLIDMDLPISALNCAASKFNSVLDYSLLRSPVHEMYFATLTFLKF